MNGYEEFIEYLHENVIPDQPLLLFDADSYESEKKFGVYPEYRYRISPASDTDSGICGVDFFPSDNGSVVYGRNLIDAAEDAHKWIGGYIDTPFLTLYDCSKTYIPGYTSPGWGESRNYFIGSGTKITALGANVFELRRDTVRHSLKGISLFLRGGTVV